MMIGLKWAAKNVLAELLHIASVYNLTESDLKEHRRAVSLSIMGYSFSSPNEKSRAEESLRSLEALAPGLSNEMISALLSGYQLVAPVVYSRRVIVDPALALTAIVDASWYVGFLVGASPLAGELPRHVRKKVLSAAGRTGGLKKNKKTADLKAWALAEADGRRGADKDIARQLAQSIPAHLVDASSSPERLIYEALLARRKLK